MQKDWPATLTGEADSEGRRSDTGGAPIVRFFVAARSAASLVSTLESETNSKQPQTVSENAG